MTKADQTTGTPRKAAKRADQAHWILPPDKIMVVNTTHIRAIIKMPETFGLESQAIKEIYNKHDEPIGFEGKARIEIMTRVMQAGWIRTRFRRNSWIAETWEWLPAQKQALWEWSKRVTAGRQQALYDRIGINSVKQVKRVFNGFVKDIFFKREFF